MSNIVSLSDARLSRNSLKVKSEFPSAAPQQTETEKAGECARALYLSMSEASEARVSSRVVQRFVREFYPDLLLGGYNAGGAFGD